MYKKLNILSFFGFKILINTFVPRMMARFMVTVRWQRKNAITNKMFVVKTALK